jgi:2-polyprenyl-3-methyl-5-hydroxy-6-metoxy-1,4-benzoquinol methylase
MASQASKQPVEPRTRTSPLTMEDQTCCLCQTSDAELIGAGEDFEYRTSEDRFEVMHCERCDLVYLKQRPALVELDRIYPASYHAFQFNEEEFGFVHKVRRRLEARRLLALCEGLGPSARILDVGCGDGFHLSLLRDFGHPEWSLEGIDASQRAVEAAARAGLTVHRGIVEEAELPVASYDLALLIATIEHVADPVGILRAVNSLLKPGGRAAIVTDNTDTLDFRLTHKRVWGGYHFPRHWSLFNRKSLRLLAQAAGMEVVAIESVLSPVNWVYSIRNKLVDSHYPPWLIEQFSLKSPISLGVFTMFDLLFHIFGRGSLVRMTVQRR